MDDCMSKEEFKNLKIGDKVLVVDHFAPDCYADLRMEKYLGNVVTISGTYDMFNIFGYPVLRSVRIKEDKGRWIWNRYLFKEKAHKGGFYKEIVADNYRVINLLFKQE